MIDASLALNINPSREPEPEYAEPQHDYILVREMTEYEMRSRGGVIMPDVTDPTGNKRASGRFEVMAVGPGPWTDRVGGGKASLLQKAKDAGVPDDVSHALNQYAVEEPASFMRRPMCVKKGDQVVFQGGGFLVNTAGMQLIAIQDYQIVAVYRKALQ